MNTDYSDCDFGKLKIWFWTMTNTAGSGGNPAMDLRPIHEGGGGMISTDDMGQFGAMQILPYIIRQVHCQRVLCSGPKTCL